ncbi:hypothetical protein NQ318_001519 [Aromia moschata]|uniref:Uncharacterized protein n=1 Tax=Aromia moschata TaxID=1265417 RepID=A0AAV8Y6Z5_9CUCU|nr:hypothetical protein NQ318_001519 [Aromia moschata]
MISIKEYSLFSPNGKDCAIIAEIHTKSGCMYNGKHHHSHTEWPSPENPCKMLRCEAGVITESEVHCHTPCANPLPPEPGKCCATCPESRDI